MRISKPVLIAVTIVSLLAFGCESGLHIPIDTDTSPRSEETSKPTSGQVASDDFGLTKSAKYREDLLAASAGDRISENEWVCLNEYLSPVNTEDQVLFDGDTGTALPLRECMLESDRRLFVWAVEYVFSEPVPQDAYFSFGSVADTPGYVSLSGLQSDGDDPAGGSYAFPDNSVWVERKDERVLLAASDPSALKISCIDLYKHPVSVAEIRVYGKVAG